MTDPLSDERIARAWTSGEAAGGCPPEDRFWRAATGALAPQDLEDLLDHTAGCPACALALSTSIAIHAESGLLPRAAGPSLWDRLRASILRPEAALAYLLLLALLVPLAWTSRRGAPAPAVATAPAAADLRAARIVAFEPESVPRGGEEPPPAAIDLPAGGALVLRLFVEVEDLDPEAPLSVRIVAPGGTLAETVHPLSVLTPEGSLDVAVPPNALPRVVPLTIEVRSGTSLVFSRRLLVR